MLPMSIALKGLFAKRMKIDPYELHPEEKNTKSQKKLLTNEKICEMIQKEVEDILSKPTPTWGYSRNQVVGILNKLITSIGA